MEVTICEAHAAVLRSAGRCKSYILQKTAANSENVRTASLLRSSI
jgi:hypothetical protein